MSHIYTQFKETGSAEKQLALTTTYKIQLLSKTSSKEQKKNKEKMKNCRKQNGKMAEWLYKKPTKVASF